MQVEIRVGNYKGKINNKITFNSSPKFDDINKEIADMYNFLLDAKDCVIIDVDQFLLYALNNGIMAFLIKDNPELKEVEFEPCNTIPKFDPDIYRIFEIKEDGTEICIQDEEGHVRKNYYNQLMNRVMNDYYSCLNFYEPKNQ